MSNDSTRREVMKKAVYIAPAVLTLASLPSFASAGSGYQGEEPRKKPKGIEILPAPEHLPRK